MKKIILSFLLIAAFASACENNAEKTSQQNQDQVKSDEITVVALKDFENKAHELVGKHVKLTGTIDHVCQHGGQKMFIVNKDTDARVKIVTGENMAAFNTDIVGETLAVVGIVDELRIDEAYLREWEEQVKGDNPPEQENAAMHAKEKKGQKMGMQEGEHEKGEVSPDMQQINNLRQQLADSGKDHLSYFSIICVDYQVIEQETEEQPTT